MRARYNILLLGLIAGVATSCSHTPRSTRDPESLASIRAQYLQDNPDGQFNDSILRGELIKGMNVIEVLASWGLPELRSFDSKTESWTYYLRDDLSPESRVYELTFTDRVLTGWSVDRTSAAVGGVTAPLLTGRNGSATRSQRTGTFNSNGGTKK